MFVEIFPINLQSRRNHVVVTFHINPETVGQVSVDRFVGSLDHPVVILPFDEEIGILVIVILSTALCIPCRLCEALAVAERLPVGIYRSLPYTGTAICSLIRRYFCRCHCEKLIQLALIRKVVLSHLRIRKPLIRRIAVIGEIPVARLMVQSEEQTARADRRRNLDRRLP